MGVHDIYGKCQIKYGPCELKKFSIGDKVPIEDGAYISYEGIVVILHGQFIAEFPDLRTKYGGRLQPLEIVNRVNPIKKAIDGMRARDDR